ncbi:MAG: hypothetical protein BWK76_21315 [Desulfobulbaceae bacterium A2]|nr:MAG: hypothetical protein BWK76_21315 [Desulfobulbaceae bacterium A2]
MKKMQMRRLAGALALTAVIAVAPLALATEKGAEAGAQTARSNNGFSLVSSAQAAELAHAGDAAHAAGHGDAQATNSLAPAKLKDLFWRTANFVALLIILIKFLAKPIASGLAGRQRSIREELEGLESKRKEAERSYREFEARLAGMEKEMETVVQRAIAQATAEKGRILAEAEKAAEDIKRQASMAVQSELIDARRRLRDEVAEQAATMAEAIIAKNLNTEDHVRITEQYLDRLGALQ